MWGPGYPLEGRATYRSRDGPCGLMRRGAGWALEQLEEESVHQEMGEGAQCRQNAEHYIEPRPKGNRQSRPRGQPHTHAACITTESRSWWRAWAAAAAHGVCAWCVWGGCSCGTHTVPDAGVWGCGHHQRRGIGALHSLGSTAKQTYATPQSYTTRHAGVFWEGGSPHSRSHC
jgi:hypothetical protein